MRALVVLALVATTACAVRAPARPTTHAANPAAPTGRLAGAPPALRPGVVVYPDVPPMQAPADAGGEHHHHH